MAEEQHILYVDLYDNPLTPKAGDYSGRVASTGSVQNTSIGTRIAAKRTEYRPETIANILDLSDQEKIEALAAGQTVNSKLGTLVLQVEGSFDGEQAPFDKTKHRLTVSFSMSKQLREALDRLQISTRSASSGLIINNVKDAESQELNGLITSGGSLIISGVNIKVAGDDEQNGVFLIPSEGEPIRARALVHNNPSQVTVLLPSLEDGEYTLSITTQYNAMIAPITRFPIRGCIWYQGESNANAGEGVEYFHKMRALIQGWRSAWKQEFPFYFVQLSSFGKVEEKPEGEFTWSSVREMQSRALELPKTGMAVTIDIGDSANIHPGNKLDVGKRLALWALKNEYGQRNLCPSGPLYRDMRKEKGGIRIRFHYAQSGLMVGEKKGIAPVREVPGGRLKQFAIAGADRKWYWADARIEGSDVFVSSPHVPDPVAVRYAFRKNPQGANLYNREGLPASPFRTDSWE